MRALTLSWGEAAQFSFAQGAHAILSLKRHTVSHRPQPHSFCPINKRRSKTSLPVLLRRRNS
jgi:hypothetical protein